MLLCVVVVVVSVVVVVVAVIIIINYDVTKQFHLKVVEVEYDNLDLNESNAWLTF